MIDGRIESAEMMASNEPTSMALNQHLFLCWPDQPTITAKAEEGFEQTMDPLLS